MMPFRKMNTHPSRPLSLLDLLTNPSDSFKYALLQTLNVVQRVPTPFFLRLDLPVGNGKLLLRRLRFL